MLGAIQTVRCSRTSNKMKGARLVPALEGLCMRNGISCLSRAEHGKVLHLCADNLGACAMFDMTLRQQQCNSCISDLVCKSRTFHYKQHATLAINSCELSHDLLSMLDLVTLSVSRQDHVCMIAVHGRCEPTAIVH